MDEVQQLLADLKARFPNQVPTITASDREIWAAVGRQEVIQHIEELLLSDETQKELEKLQK